MQEIGLEMQGIIVGMQGIRLEMQEIGLEMQGIMVGMQGMKGNQCENLRIGVKLTN